MSTKDLGEIQDSVYPEIAFALENLDIILEIRIDIRKLIDIRKFKNVIYLTRLGLSILVRLWSILTTDLGEG